jgi:phosphoenolpyruvate synthase/pyruvate phosphate dikinase
MALVRYGTLTDENAKRQIAELTEGYQDKTEYFVDRLARGLARIAAAYHPKPVIVRMSDFKTNEYANLIGGAAFEPTEENPMLGFRGASRYYSPRYREGFDLAQLFDEQDEAVKWMIENVIREAHKAGAKVGLCGQAPSDHPEFAEFLVRCGIDSMSVSPDSFIAVKEHVAAAETNKALRRA